MRRIRRARHLDAAPIAKVYVDTWRSIYAGLLPDRVLLDMSYRSSAAYWTRAMIVGAGLHGVHVAEETGRVVGFASCGLSRERRLPYAGEVYTLYVLDDHQGAGLGRELLLACFKDLLERGMSSALVWVLADNPARFFYEAMGGKRIAEREEKMWGTSLSEAAYGWPDTRNAFARRRFSSTL